MNIDYLGYGLDDQIIDEISYLVDPVNIQRRDNLFTAGETCSNIYIISSGEINVYLNNNGQETYIDTLYTGWTLGSYSALKCEDYTITARAKGDWSLLKLQFSKLNKLREKYNDLDEVMYEYEQYCDNNGLPYLDYKLHRTKHFSMKPLDKFKYGIKRIIRIIKSYKEYKFTELMEEVRNRIINEKDMRESILKKRRKSQKNSQLSPEERNEKFMILIFDKLEDFSFKINSQQEIIRRLSNDLSNKIHKINSIQESEADSKK